MTATTCPNCGAAAAPGWCRTCGAYFQPVTGAPAPAHPLRCTAQHGSVRCTLNCGHVGDHAGQPPVGVSFQWPKFPAA